MNVFIRNVGPSKIMNIFCAQPLLVIKYIILYVQSNNNIIKLNHHISCFPIGDSQKHPNICNNNK